MGTIAVLNLGKAYKQYSSKWARLREWIMPAQSALTKIKWVLQDISFTIEPGQAVGILGVNGAGKSTLLKMITGTTQPTTGDVHIVGRVAALLELGMGFHPDFTGRQNAYMAGQLMGFGEDEIKALMPEIEAFADIGEYLDQAVRVYSSGMQVRLAFAVATSVRPDILIIDEALSVGDAAFQRKCFQRIENYRQAGTTLLFVSHDTETVKKLCDNALFLKQGKLEQWGEAKSVCDAYERFLFGGTGKSGANHRTKSPSRSKLECFDPALSATACEVVYGNGKAEIVDCWLSNELGEHINVIESGTPFFWRYKVHFNEDVANPIFAMMLKTKEGFALYGVDSKENKHHKRKFNKGDTIEVSFRLSNPLAPGVYYLNCGVRLDLDSGTEFLSRRVDTALLKVVQAENSTVKTGLLEMHADLVVNNY